MKKSETGKNMMSNTRYHDTAKKRKREMKKNHYAYIIMLRTLVD